MLSEWVILFTVALVAAMEASIRAKSSILEDPLLEELRLPYLPNVCQLPDLYWVIFLLLLGLRARARSAFLSSMLASAIYLEA